MGADVPKRDRRRPAAHIQRPGWISADIRDPQTPASGTRCSPPTHKAHHRFPQRSMQGGRCTARRQTATTCGLERFHSNCLRCLGRLNTPTIQVPGGSSWTRRHPQHRFMERSKELRPGGSILPPGASPWPQYRRRVDRPFRIPFLAVHLQQGQLSGQDDPWILHCNLPRNPSKASQPAHSGLPTSKANHPLAFYLSRSKCLHLPFSFRARNDDLDLFRTQARHSFWV